MKIKSISLESFRRFNNLILPEIPPAKLVILAGPNGSGKSSLFDAFSVWLQAHVVGLSWDEKYHSRSDAPLPWERSVKISFHDDKPLQRNSFYIRTAYRHEADFQIGGLSRMGEPDQDNRPRRMIDGDAAVSVNYQRLASNALQDAFDRSSETITLKSFRENTIGEIRSAILNVFPYLDMSTLGNPLEDGTFRFTKGAIKNFSYKNLSGGERAAFDLILDLVVKKSTFNDTVFCIDEPETHLNARVQGSLLRELFRLIPGQSQLWIATHSIGMMRAARDLANSNPNDVIFYDFDQHDYDKAVELHPVRPDRTFWQRVLHVALDDLADLVAPKQIVICEGNPVGAVPGKNEEHDARCYGIIFQSEYPDTVFIAGGNSNDVASDRLRFASVFPHVVKGIGVRWLIDRDDHSPQDAADFRKEQIWTLGRRHLECYLFDDEIINKLYDKHGRGHDAGDAIVRKNQILVAAVANRQRPHDDLKASAPQIVQDLKRDLQLTAVGNDASAFARNVLSPLVSPETSVYQELKREVFGP